jgi:hypothetical protein
MSKSQRFPEAAVGISGNKIASFSHLALQKPAENVTWLQKLQLSST